MININITKAKEIAHTLRRTKREAEFKPFDEAISKQIPVQMENAEAQRQLIRNKYAIMQQEIDIASTPEEIKKALGEG